MDSVLVDLRDAVRGLRRDPLYAVAVVATLGLTLGASTAVFSIVSGVLLKPLTYAEPSRIVSIREIVGSIAGRYPTLPANARHFDVWRQRATAFTGLAEIDWRTTSLTGTGDPAQVTIVRAAGPLLDVLGVNVALGRALTADDEQRGNPAVAVISDRLWTERFGRDPGVLGRPIVLGGTQYAIVGVTPRGLELPNFEVLGESAALSSAFSAIVAFRPNFDNVDWMGEFNYPVVARLKPGVSLDQARAEMNVAQHAVAVLAAEGSREPPNLSAWMLPLEESVVGRTRLGLLLLLGTIGGVVLIACANLANLSLTRAIGRSRDAAVRSALGASRRRLVRGVVLEQLLLAAIGGALGVFVARLALNIFVRTAPVDIPRVNNVVIDGRVLVFSATVAVAAGLCVALLPAWRIGRGTVQNTLRGGGHGSTDRGGLRVRATLLATQIAMSVTLLVVTGLFVTSFVRLLQVDPGFSADHVVAVEIAPVSTRYPDAQARAALYDRILAATRRLADINSAAWTSALPLTGETWVDLMSHVGDTQPSSRKPEANYRFVGPEYFKTLSMPITKGRSIEERDRGRVVVPAVISARAARTMWPGQDPIGRQFTRGDPSSRFEVVGVIADGHPTALEADSPLMVYVPYWYNNEGKSVLVVGTKAGPSTVAGELRGIVHDVDPEIAVADVSPLQNVVDRATAGRRYQMWLFTAFGLVALVIATVGVYATTAYGVSRRKREMNIRVALGARASQVFALVLMQSARPVTAGILAGCAGALAVGSVVASLLFKVRAADPFVVAGVVVVVGAAAMLASAAAARQGLQLDPARSLRDE